ncbi:GNAT family N-acetyltransferase [Massilia sp. CF038]|uniref:GNAT family N-acetyltransferase n=1 Tax=Massilia sp. CF038 TaxID=1881045 RepID=UPI00090F53C5|nr:GNAT family N-acetyltransferase [Massilia sp. CF038]SHH65456.1 Acetyltransferase (GNAT) family protein [Massilia sp. CF038]
MKISACDPASADAQVLMEELSATLAAITGASGKASFAAGDAGLVFVVARADDCGLLGCGAVRPLAEGVGEIKRMYARPGTRGVGAAILAHLETQGFPELWLETRKVNARAVAFYRKHGYAEMPNYGQYIGRAEAICFRKTF